MVCLVLTATLPDVPLAHAASVGVPDADIECTFPQSDGVWWFDWHTLAIQPRTTKTVTVGRFITI